MTNRRLFGRYKLPRFITSDRRSILLRDGRSENPFQPIDGPMEICCMAKEYFFPAKIQLMVNCWFGAFSGLGFKSGYTKESQSLSCSGIPGIQTTGPQTNNQPLAEKWKCWTLIFVFGIPPNPTREGRTTPTYGWWFRTPAPVNMVQEFFHQQYFHFQVKGRSFLGLGVARGLRTTLRPTRLCQLDPPYRKENIFYKPSFWVSTWTFLGCSSG